MGIDFGETHGTDSHPSNTMGIPSYTNHGKWETHIQNGKHAENIAPVHRITPFPTGTVCFPFPTLSFKWESHAFETLGNSPEQYLGKPVHAFETLGNSPIQNNMGNIHLNWNIGKVWYDNLCEWGENRYAVAETFAMKQHVEMIEDAWVTSSGRSDVVGLQLWMSHEKGRRDTMG
jgi:hypothetical protein